MNNPPAEVLHQICKLLPIKDIAAVRLTNKTLAEVGAHYLVRQVKFHTSKASLDRLEFLANHPVLNQYVHTISFEANLLPEICCQSTWMERFVNNHHGNHEGGMPQSPTETSSPREKRLFARNLAKWEDLQMKNFEKYRELYKTLQDTHASAPDIMDRTIDKFSRVQHIRINLGRCQHVLSERFVEDFDGKVGFCVPVTHDTAPTENQLKHLLLPAGKPLLSLKSLSASDICPDFFQDQSIRSLVHTAFTSLKKIDLSFRLADRDEYSQEPGPYVNFLDGCLSATIANAVELEDLRIAFMDYTYDGPCVDVKHVLGENKFPKLKRLSLGYVDSTPTSLLACLKRQESLKFLAIQSCYMTDGNWSDVIVTMRKELDLTSALFIQFLQDEDRMYDMSLAETDFYMDDGTAFTVTDAIDAYITDDYPECLNPLDRYDDDFEDESELERRFEELMAEFDSEDDEDDSGSKLSGLEDMSE